MPTPHPHPNTPTPPPHHILHHVLQVSLMRLNTLAAILSVEEPTPHVEGQLSFLQCLLAYAVKAVDTYAVKQLQYYQWDGIVGHGAMCG